MTTIYCRLTFRPAGAERARTVWAHRGAAHGGIKFFEVVDSDGCSKEPKELIIASEADILSERDARQNLHYGGLEVVDALELPGMTVLSMRRRGNPNGETTMDNDREWIPEEAREILDKAICAICPNPIGSAGFGMIKERDIVGELVKRASPGTVITGPHGPFMLIHHRCYNNARLVLGMDPDGEEET